MRKSIGTQTLYGAKDVQSMFLRRMDEVLGMKAYRPVSPHGNPRLEIEAREAQVERLVHEKSAYQAKWNHSRAKVGNVANVKKMRKFEPLRKHM